MPLSEKHRTAGSSAFSGLKGSVLTGQSEGLAQ